jgi:hypothetical protein
MASLSSPEALDDHLKRVCVEETHSVVVLLVGCRSRTSGKKHHIKGTCEVVDVLEKHLIV